MRGALFIVSGKVQGVFYRGSAREKALALGLAGYAQNLPDGSVEVLALGDDIALDAMEEWLRQGPPAAHVTQVTRRPVERDALHGFATR